jgi:1,2-phenylacetyl-CoA epoxidase catalytic subunit
MSIPATLAPETKNLLLAILRRQASCELMSANILGHSLKYVPEFPYKVAMAQMIEEQIERYQQISRIYSELSSGSDLFEDPDLRVSHISYPENWFELAMVQYLFDRSSEYNLREYRECRYEPYAQIARAIFREDRLKGGFGEKVIRGFCRYPTNRSEAQRLFNLWFPVALLNLEFPDPAQEFSAIQAGLKKREASAAIQDFIQDSKATMRECGLKFPPLEDLDVSLPADLDLAL